MPSGTHEEDKNQLNTRPNMVEAVMFDFDGTLVDYIDSDTKALGHLHSAVAAAVPFTSFFETAVAQIMLFHDLVEKNQIDPLEMHRFRLQNTFFLHHIQWADEYIAIYKTALLNHCIPFDGIEPMLSMLKKHVKVGLITNAYDSVEQRERIKNSGLAPYFDTLVIAGDVNLYKPDPGIFRYALSALEVKPENALFVGDSYAHDIFGAKAVGMNTVFVGKKAKHEVELADYVVSSSVKELTKVLCRVLHID